MTDDEYASLLRALAGKHLKPLQPSLYPIPYLQNVLERISSTARLSRVAAERVADQILLDRLCGELEQSPVEEAARHMDEVGIPDALDDAPSLVFGQFRRSAIPSEDIALLRRAGFTDDEVEVLLAVAVEQAHVLANRSDLPSNVVAEAAEALRRAVESLRLPLAPAAPEKKKRKILNGIGKLLGGAIAGVGNVPLATGTLVAPNPATGAAAIASGGLTVSSWFAGLGDLRGE
jgi:hypothetical protein